jgi:hypothetical protein
VKKRKASDLNRERISSRRAAYCLTRPPYKNNPYSTPSVLGRHTIFLPNTLSVFSSSSREKLYILLRQLREVPSTSKLTLDFSSLSKIKISAILVLFAHLEILLENNKNARLIWIKPTDTTIDAKLSELGLWALLGEKYRPVEGAIRICSVSSAQNQIDEKQPLRDAINYARNAITSYELPDSPEDTDNASFAAISESFTNVWQHAYAEDLQRNHPTLINPSKIQKWWIAQTHIDGQLFMAVYDVGVGIPFSTRRRPWYKSLHSDILHTLKGMNSDSRDIQTALAYGTSRYKQQGRGNGLPTMKRFVEINPNGELCIISGKGVYKYKSKDNREEFSNLDSSYPGTLIQWNIALTEDHGNSDED